MSIFDTPPLVRYTLSPTTAIPVNGVPFIGRLNAVFHCASVKLSSGEPVTNFMRSIGQSGGVIVILVLHNGFSGSVVSLVSVIVVGMFIFTKIPAVSVPAGTENVPFIGSPVTIIFSSKLLKY